MLIYGPYSTYIQKLSCLSYTKPENYTWLQYSLQKFCSKVENTTSTTQLKATAQLKASSHVLTIVRNCESKGGVKNLRRVKGWGSTFFQQKGRGEGYLLSEGRLVFDSQNGSFNRALIKVCESIPNCRPKRKKCVGNAYLHHHANRSLYPI
jgi:hypothetical protein